MASITEKNKQKLGAKLRANLLRRKKVTSEKASKIAQNNAKIPIKTSDKN